MWTALDPAKPIFEIKDDTERLDASDAEFVQVIHTASGFLSFLEPVGHADFYPNGGKAPQPPCPGEEGDVWASLDAVYSLVSLAVGTGRVLLTSLLSSARFILSKLFPVPQEAITIVANIVMLFRIMYSY